MKEKPIVRLFSGENMSEKGLLITGILDLVIAFLGVLSLVLYFQFNSIYLLALAIPLIIHSIVFIPIEKDTISIVFKQLSKLLKNSKSFS